MGAIQVLREAQATGLRLRVEAGQVRLTAERAPPAELLERLRAHKRELIELLRGERCHGCGERLAWPAPVGVVHGDGRASCLPCYYQGTARRAACLVRSLHPSTAPRRRPDEP